MADNSTFENTKKVLKKQINYNQKELEKITKKYNAILSVNVKKRTEINACRKERTLYDHIFKTLEYQILDQESKLYKVIKKNKKKEELLHESQRNLENINELVSKSNYDDFYKLIEEEKKKYLTNLDELKKEVRSGKELYESMFLQRKTINTNKISHMKKTNESKQSSLRESDLQALAVVNSQIEFLESLKNEFKFHTGDENQETIDLFYNGSDEYNEELYKQFCELEDQYEDLKLDYKDNLHVTEKLDNYSISTKASVSKPIDVEDHKDAKEEFKECTNELKAILVS